MEPATPDIDSVIDAPLESALAELANSDRLLVALDFDGTLSGLVDDPMGARVIPAARVAIERLRQLPDTWVAYVSGRPLAGLAEVTEAKDDELLIGSHGVEVRLDGQAVDLGLSEDEKRRLTALGAALTEIVAATPGANLEHKPVGYGVHTRLVSDQGVAQKARDAAWEAADRIGGLSPRKGKDMVEFAVRDVTKGDGIELLRQREAITATLYAGDDVTDEDGFAVLGKRDVGIKVGQGDTTAAYRVADPEALAAALALLAERRASAR
jgi:trehalose 6-phosphate phosphatase